MWEGCHACRQPSDASTPAVCALYFQRNIHSSPAAFTVDRVVQCFRARSALLVSRLEDDDEVLHKTFSDSDDKDDAGDELTSDQSNNE